MQSELLPRLNKVFVIGFLTRDPELRYTTTNVPVINFRIACRNQHDDGSGSPRENISHFGVVAWQKLAEDFYGCLHKGDAVLIEGELKSRIRNDGSGSRRTFVEIRAQHIQFLNQSGGRNESIIEDNYSHLSREAGHESNAEADVAVTAAVTAEADAASTYDYDDNNL